MIEFKVSKLPMQFVSPALQTNPALVMTTVEQKEPAAQFDKEG
jgi:hypothetical protein